MQSRGLRSAVVVVAAVVLAASPLAAQVTTGSVSGRITTREGQPVAAATVTVINRATGFRVVVMSRGTGAYLVPGLEPGGPYTVRVQAIGFRPATENEVRVPLAAAVTVDFSLEPAPVQLEEVVVTSDPLAAEFSATRQGTQTIVGDTAIRRQPSLDRDLSDFTKLTPQVALRDGGEGGVVALGQNNRFNTVQLDGATVNDRFGLGRTGFAGGQAEGKPVALEAVKELQVLVAPYDVRQGNFSGALLNAITKSGTNEFRATGFFQYRDNGLAGDPLGLSEFNNKQFGGSFGGPIKRDKALFFLAGELRRAARPANGPYLGSTPAPVFTSADYDALVQAAGSRYGLSAADLGSLGQVNNERPTTNLTGRLDYLMGQSRLVFRYNYNQAESDVFSRNASGTIDLSSYGYYFNSKNHNPAIQLYTNFANGASNELLVSYNRIRDRRTPRAQLPAIQVQNFASAGGSGTYTLEFGGEQFSQGNELDQDIFELTDNYSFSVGAHRITLGTRNEYYKVRNLFAQSSYGVWQFDNLSDFAAGVAERYTVSGPLSENFPVKFRTGQLGFYVQDAYSPTPSFSLTAGLRADLPFWVDQPHYADAVITDFGQQKVPNFPLMLSPRVGFNWDVSRDGVNQIRGGLGVFSGTPAYVWFSNFFQQSGTGLGILTCGQGSSSPAPAVPTTFDVNNPVRACGDGTTLGPGASLGEINLVQPGTRFPQVFRTNLAWDHRLPGEAILTLEGTFTKGINDIVMVNRNLAGPVAEVGQGGRVLYGALNANGTVTPNYFNLARYGPSFSAGVLELRNASSSLAWSATAQLRKSFGQALQGSIAYTLSAAYDAASFTSSRATSNWRFGRVFSGRDDDFNRTRSSFDRPHRIVANATYSFPWRKYPTDLSVTYIGQSGQPYTLISGGSSGRGDLNRDGYNGNDPIYIPTDATNTGEIQFIQSGNLSPQQQAQIFEDYIAGEPCLDQQRGRIMERNSCRNPWQNFLDLNVRQSLPTIGGRLVTLELGIFNVLNLLDSDWGVVKTADGGQFYQVTALFMPSSGGVVNGREAWQLGNNIPLPTSLATGNQRTTRFISTTDPANSYQVQLGIRVAY